MTAQSVNVAVEAPLSLIFLVNKTRKPNQTINERFVELIESGIKQAEAEKQLDMLIEEGKIQC
jgi:hypothetical protein